MSELAPRLAAKEELVATLKRHKAVALEAGGNSSAVIFGIVTDSSHNRFLEVGEVVNQGWYGEGGITLRYVGNIIEAFGGDMSRGGVSDNDVLEVRPDLLEPEQRKLLKQVCYDPENILGEEFGKEY